MRFEQKFLLSVEQYADLASRFDLLFERDPHCGPSGTYCVLSRYYDTRDLDFYYAKIHGESEQIKVRLRKYSTNWYDATPLYLEAKIKSGELQQKVRIHGGQELLNREHWRSLPGEGQWFDGLLSQTSLQPVSSVFYQRRAYGAFLEGLPYRLNIDEGIVFFPGEIEDAMQDALPFARQESFAVLEIKSLTRKLPAVIVNQLRRHALVSETVSKYQFSVENVYGGLLHD